MTPRKQKNLRQPPSPDVLRVMHPHAAGIDVHSAVHSLAVPAEAAPPPPANQPPNLTAHARSFGSCTADLTQLADRARAASRESRRRRGTARELHVRTESRCQ